MPVVLGEVDVIKSLLLHATSMTGRASLQTFVVVVLIKI
jgi:hypothetical protein